MCDAGESVESLDGLRLSSAVVDMALCRLLGCEKEGRVEGRALSESEELGRRARFGRAAPENVDRRYFGGRSNEGEVGFTQKLVSLKGMRGKERETRVRKALLQGLLIGARGCDSERHLGGDRGQRDLGREKAMAERTKLALHLAFCLDRKHEGEEQRSIVLGNYCNMRSDPGAGEA